MLYFELFFRIYPFGAQYKFLGTRQVLGILCYGVVW